MPIPPENSCAQITFRQAGLTQGATANIQTTTLSKQMYFVTPNTPNLVNQISLASYQTLRMFTYSGQYYIMP